MVGQLILDRKIYKEVSKESHPLKISIITSTVETKSLSIVELC
jgi:hypothetical protein